MYRTKGMSANFPIQTLIIDKMVSFTTKYYNNTFSLSKPVKQVCLTPINLKSY